MTGLAGVASSTQSRVASEDHTDADPDFSGHEQEIVDARRHTAAMLGEGAEVGLVGDRDRGVSAEALGEHLSEWDIPPSKVGSEVHEPVSPPRQTDDGDADAGEVVPDGHRGDQRLGQLDGVLDGLAGRESTTLTVDADAVVHVSTESHRRHGDRVDGQLDGQDDGTLGAGRDDG